MKLRKITAVLAAALLTMTAMTACSGGAASSASSETPSSESSAASAESASSESTSSESASSEETTGGDMTGEITVLSREDGSGTRGAFIELFGIEQKNDAGEKEDMTTDDAQITNSTSVMMTTVQGNPKAIGYISLGSLDESVVKAGTYKVVRPFNIATKGEASEVAQDFINFIMSADGQKVVSENGYITVNDAAPAYAASGVSGKVVVGGSSSVTPVMEKLKEAYMALNPDVTVEVQQSDSTTGMTSTIDGAYDIGMASRELKDSELEAGLTPTVIAQDGIAVIVNKENTLTGLTSEQVLSIYTGETTDWSELQ